MSFAGKSLEASYVGRSAKYQLPITDFAHKTAVEGDDAMAESREGVAEYLSTH